MPKRSRNGLVSMPARVVAPTSVNGGRSILTLRAAGPSPIMMSIWKSSSAGYRISSTIGDSRWVSSMNSTSRGSRFVRIAARSPGRSSTGPDVWRRFTPSSCARMCDSVVLPSPGGPNSSTWSSASQRLRAASMKMPSWSRIFSWPMYSASWRGRSARSSASSCVPVLFVATMRVSSSFSIAIVTSCFREQLQRLLDSVGHGDAVGKLRDRCGCFALAVTERDERMHDIRRRRRQPGDAAHVRKLAAELVLQLEQQPLGGLLADARHARQTCRLLQRDRLRELGDRQPRQQRQRDLRPDAVDLQQLAECAPLAVAAESVEQVRVLAHDEMREQRHALAVLREVVERAHRHVHLVGHPLHVEQQLRWILFEQRARETADHGAQFYSVAAAARRAIR